MLCSVCAARQEQALGLPRLGSSSSTPQDARLFITTPQLSETPASMEAAPSYPFDSLKLVSQVVESSRSHAVPDADRMRRVETELQRFELLRLQRERDQHRVQFDPIPSGAQLAELAASFHPDSDSDSVVNNNSQSSGSGCEHFSDD